MALVSVYSKSTTRFDGEVLKVADSFVTIRYKRFRSSKYDIQTFPRKQVILVNPGDKGEDNGFIIVKNSRTLIWDAACKSYEVKESKSGEMVVVATFEDKDGEYEQTLLIGHDCEMDVIEEDEAEVKKTKSSKKAPKKAKKVEEEEEELDEEDFDEDEEEEEKPKAKKKTKKAPAKKSNRKGKKKVEEDEDFDDEGDEDDDDEGEGW